MENSPYQKVQQLIDTMEQVIYGKRQVIEMTVTALLAGGHVLFEDVPGVGKTLLAKTLTQAIQADFKRVQFTPDLLPSDLLGVSVFNRQTQDFEFHQGPLFTTVLLADELNRTTPRTQAALLEAMSEGQVTIDNATYPLNPHFFVLATQNPIEYEGTYPLPEAQLDRFLFRLQIGYPSAKFERQLLLQDQTSQVSPILSLTELSQLKTAVDHVKIADVLLDYALILLQATRQHPEILLGISPRAGRSFVQAARAYALVNGRDYVLPDDFQVLAEPVFHHRLVLDPLSEKNASQLIQELLQATPIPER